MADWGRKLTWLTAFTSARILSTTAVLCLMLRWVQMRAAAATAKCKYYVMSNDLISWIFRPFFTNVRCRLFPLSDARSWCHGCLYRVVSFLAETSSTQLHQREGDCDEIKVIRHKWKVPLDSRPTAWRDEAIRHDRVGFPCASSDSRFCLRHHESRNRKYNLQMKMTVE